MEQEKFGEKIQNWHRPLGKSELRQRFRRHRYDDPQAESDRVRYLRGEVEVDDYWDPFNPNRYCAYCGTEQTVNSWCSFTASDETDFLMYAVHRVLSEYRNLPSPLLGAEVTTETIEIDPESPSSADRTVSVIPLEERLGAHLHSHASPALQGALRDAVGGADNVRVLDRVGEAMDGPSLTNQLCLFSPFWIRAPKTWKGNGVFSLLDHLFIRYPVPQFLYPLWLRDVGRHIGDIASQYFKWQCWFILIGQGGSLKRAGRLHGWNVTNRFQHFLSADVASSSPVEACIRAEIARLGGTEVEVERFLGNSSYVTDPTNSPRNSEYTDFWQNSVRWFTRHGEALNDEDADLVLHWAMHQHTEAVRAERRFSWRGRSVQATVQRSRAYRDAIAVTPRRRNRVGYKWKPHGWSWTVEDKGASWTFVELTTEESLRTEGRNLNHCVASYVGMCVARQSAIVSLRCDGVPNTTIEVDPATRRIVQARGNGNCWPAGAAAPLIERWSAEVLELPQSL